MHARFVIPSICEVTYSDQIIAIDKSKSLMPSPFMLQYAAKHLRLDAILGIFLLRTWDFLLCPYRRGDCTEWTIILKTLMILEELLCYKIWYSCLKIYTEKKINHLPEKTQTPGYRNRQGKNTNRLLALIKENLVQENSNNISLFGAMMVQCPCWGRIRGLQ